MNELKKFYFKVLIILLPLTIGAFLLDPIISKAHSETKELPDEYTVWNDIYNGEINCHFAIVGSSRAWVHFDPKIMTEKLGQQVYNFGVDGHNFQLQYLRHLEFLKFNPKPKFVIVSLDMGTFQKNTNFYNYQQLLPYMLFNHNYRKNTNSFKLFSLYEYYVPLLRYAGERSVLSNVLDNWLNSKTPITYRQNGFYAMNMNFQPNELKKNTNIKIEIDHKLTDLFFKFIENCKRNNIGLIFVYSPEYILGQKYCQNRNELMRFYRGVSEKFNIPFLDYSKHAICNNKDYFYNYTHLNKKGSKRFSEVFCIDLNKTLNNTYE